MMPSDAELDPPITPAIAEGRGEVRPNDFARVNGNAHSEAHVAFHFGALYVLQLVQQVVAERSAEAAALALGMLNSELEEFMEAHAVAVQ
jgi:hypothetical protein